MRISDFFQRIVMKAREIAQCGNMAATQAWVPAPKTHGREENPAPKSFPWWGSLSLSLKHTHTNDDDGKKKIIFLKEKE